MEETKRIIAVLMLLLFFIPFIAWEESSELEAQVEIEYITKPTVQIETLTESEPLTEVPTEIETSTSKYSYIEHPVPSGYPFKCYMPYNLFVSTSRQYQLQLEAYTGDYGLRMLNGKYLVAVGTGWGADVGTEIVVVMKNGYELTCVVGDIKADIHTDSTNKIGGDGSIIEFIVDVESMDTYAKYRGDISVCNLMFEGEIECIRVYEFRN